MAFQLIHAAAAGGDLAEVNRLLEEDGQRLSALGGDEHITSLVAAAIGGHDAVVVRLIELGRDVNLQSHSGMSAAYLAAARHVSTLGLLLDAGADVNMREMSRWTPLMRAAGCGATACVRLLVARGGDADAASETGATALHIAALEGHSQVVSLLLKAGANPTVHTNDGESPLETAQRLGHHNCTALLEPAIAERERSRMLLKARALIDTGFFIRKTDRDGQKKGLSREEMDLAARRWLRLSWL